MADKYTVLSVDGNTAAAHVAYAMTDMSFIYPITPSTPMGALADQWSCEGRINCFGQTNCVTEMQSEAGAAGAVHGALTGGALCTTYTASQGLLLMIPNMYKIAGELMPCVFHVAARAIAAQALSIYGEHSDVMAVRSTGFALLSSHSVQEAHDFAVISHIATLKSSIPFLHFFDGFRTSHEIQKVNLLKYDELKKLIPLDKVQLHRDRAANPEHPHLRGSAQSPDIFFQMSERCNVYYDKVAEIVDNVCEELKVVLGKRYKLFEYYGCNDATDVVIVMGSGCEVMEEVCDYLNKKGSKIGILKVHLYRPWSAKHFISELPKTVKRITVLDRCKDVVAMGEPLFIDVASTLALYPNIKVDILVGGRYGLGSKDFTPGMGLSVIYNMRCDKPIPRFTVGINDDVTHLSLPEVPEPDTLPDNMSQCIFWGLGSDGTVGANKDAIKIIGDHTDKTIQAYFAYDAKKSGGITQSYLRFGDVQIKSPYLVKRANYIAVHKTNFIYQFDVIECIKEGGYFVLNSHWDTLEDMEAHIPAKLKKQIAIKKVHFYNINAIKVGKLTGLGKRVNQVLQTVFFYLSGVIPIEQAKEYMKAAIKKTYGKKGEKVLNMNYQAVDLAVENLVEIKYPESWLTAIEKKVETKKDLPDFIEKVMIPVSQCDGDKLPVSVFPDAGIFPAGTTKYEKRGIALTVPEWNSGNCTQCNRCSTVCPHAAIRSFLFNDEELKVSPDSFVTIKSTLVPTNKYRIQVSPYDCTGCELCVRACDDDALKMQDIDYMIETQKDNWEYAISCPSKGELAQRDTLRGSQFYQPMLEFSGACEGCGETPYVKLITQLFGERMVIANATGCSSIWGGMASFNPYTTNSKGQGPSWANSLFEDNAEYGLGIKIAGIRRREKHLALVKELLNNNDINISNKLKGLLQDWVLNYDDGPICQKIVDQIKPLLEVEKDNHILLNQIYESRDQFPRISMWIIGGDGWAYDIGYGGVDHVLASGQDVNVVVLDTEMYSNTGGQCSKATQFGAVAQFSANGKRLHKKEMPEMAMSYGNVYVASVCMYSNMSQVVKAFTEAESYKGPSIIFCYSPCISMGISGNMAGSFLEAQAAVDSGYWPLYRWDPRLVDQHINPFQLDSKKLKVELSSFLSKEVRFQSLMQRNPDLATALQGELAHHVKDRHQHLVSKSTAKVGEGKSGNSGTDGFDLTILYGSETGNAEGLAKVMYDDAISRGLNVQLSSCDDYDAEVLPTEKNIVVIVSTCGQGVLPKNCVEFYNLLNKLPNNALTTVNYAVYGLGDSNYKFFNEAAKKYDIAMNNAGAKKFADTGLGNDHDEDGFMTKYMIWEELVWKYLNVDNVTLKPKESKYTISIVPNTSIPTNIRRPTSSNIKLYKKIVTTPENYDRYMMHLEFDIKESNMTYVAGNALAIYPYNDTNDTINFINYIELNPNDVISIKPKDSKLNGVLPNICSIQQLIGNRLDIFGKPTKKFYQALLSYITDDSTKATIQRLISEEGKEEFSALVKETVTYADIIMKFNFKPTIEQLIELVPQIKPRYYSIASSPIAHKGELHLCIVLVDWKAPSGRERKGLCTSYLQSLTPSLEAPIDIECTVKESAMTMPEDPATPIVTAGLGTGIAPFRSFVEERATLKSQGKAVGDYALYYGCRYEKTEYLYGDEWSKYVNDGVIKYLKPAFSRDQERKVYIQTKIDDEPEVVYDILYKQNGNFYYCGQSGPVPGDIRKAIVRAFVKCGGISEEEANSKVESMEVSGKYVVESW